MNDDVISLLKVHEYFRGASVEAMREVAEAGRVSQHAAGEVVHEANVPVTTVGFVLRGRLKAVRVDARGTESLFRMVERGEQFGMMVGAQTEPVPIRVIALEPTTVLNLDYDEAMELTVRHPGLRRLWLSTFAGSLRKHFFGAARKRAPMVLALVHESAATRGVAGRLIDRLRGLGEKLAVFGDSDDRRILPDVPFRALRGDGRDLELEEIRRQAAEWHDANRIVFEPARRHEARADVAAAGERAGWSTSFQARRPMSPWTASERLECRPAGGAARSAWPGCSKATAQSPRWRRPFVISPPATSRSQV